MGSARNYLKNIMATPHVARVRMVDITLTDNADVYISLLKCDDDPDYDLISDGTNIAECQVGSMIQDVNLAIMMHGMAANDREEIIFFRDPDVALTTTVTPVSLFTSDYTTATQAIKKATMWYSMYQMMGAGTGFQTAPRIRHAALLRNKNQLDGDVIKISFHQNDGGVTRKVNIVGRITHAV